MKISKLTLLPKANVERNMRKFYKEVYFNPSTELAAKKIEERLTLLEKYNQVKTPSKINKKAQKQLGIPSFINPDTRIDSYSRDLPGFYINA